MTVKTLLRKNQLELALIKLGDIVQLTKDNGSDREQKYIQDSLRVVKYELIRQLTNIKQFDKIEQQESD
tara:strand:+ start:140 stop:346 length:207 start_codon:yes stop_codon:yes gene_type:complete